MKVWYDACTGKHIRYGTVIARKLRSLGHEVILTTRRHPDTLALSRLLREKFEVVGKYAPTSSASRLKESLKRQLAFWEIFENEPPDYAISHGSIELCRVAFGLGVPTISTADAPHAIAANRLTIPLVDWVLTSKAIPKEEYQKFGAKKIVQFDGVDEVAWIKNFKPRVLEYESPLIVVRQMEIHASYARSKRDITQDLASKLSSLGNVLFISRYDREARCGLTVPQKFVDSASLAAMADLVVTVGGTISREAALQGIPSVVIAVFGSSFVNAYLSKLGFPLFTVKPSQVFKFAKKLLGRKLDVKEKLEKLENPIDYIKKIISRRS
ncbi:MAG: DUF354 domain-containing protein [Candidatus Bathyarchaeota archaeon]|nr:MAG: DUF354 domain-containing protein [Candidatus Bathyarchaeota archaeon]